MILSAALRAIPEETIEAAILDGANPFQVFWKAKIATARFFADHVLAQAPGLAASVVGGAAGTLALSVEQF